MRAKKPHETPQPIEAATEETFGALVARLERPTDRVDVLERVLSTVYDLGKRVNTRDLQALTRPRNLQPAKPAPVPPTAPQEEAANE